MTGRRPRRRLDRLDWGLLGAHALVTVGLAVAALLGVSDPDWGGVQRFLILMALAIWIWGIVGVGVLLRWITRRWLRVLLILAAPTVILVVVFAGLARG
jgi:hypothetical protein